MTFPCTQCGACCRSIAGIVELRHLDRGDGTCVHVTDANTCAIYETRPRECRVDEMRPKGMSVEAWHGANLDACEQLRRRLPVTEG